MKVRIYKNDDGTMTVFVKRTMAKENPSRAATRVKQEDMESVIAKLAGEMRGHSQQEYPL